MLFSVIVWWFIGTVDYRVSLVWVVIFTSFCSVVYFVLSLVLGRETHDQLYWRQVTNLANKNISQFSPKENCFASFSSY